MSQIKSCVLPQRHRLFMLKANVGPPSKSLPASLAEIVIAHRTQNVRLQF
jgi:hypothetical protein